MRKTSFLAFFAISFVLLLAGQATAAVCVNANKPDGAGNVGNIIFRLDGTISFPTNPAGKMAGGGFADIWVELDADGDGEADGMVKVADDVFILDARRRLAQGIEEPPELPHGAHLAAGCGRGVDSLIVCGP